MAVLISLTLAAGPAYAHGEEEHGETLAASVKSSPGHDETMPSEQMFGEASETGHSDGGHDEVSGGHAEDQTGALGVLKRLHPATVHFPIALFLMAALTELFIMSRRGAGLDTAVRAMIYGGAAGAVVAAGFGWIHTGLWFGGETTMQAHRWLGTLLAIFGLVLAGLAKRGGDSRAALRTLLFLIAAVVIVQGFLGGELAHGPDHLKIF
ncbi:hypothetical protein JI59_04680 [Novosphingobium pentaromativorans US6-1]|nr:hypothetical protein JI59_04680 [Novosphingobium pentaromativorans US6-1]